MDEAKPSLLSRVFAQGRMSRTGDPPRGTEPGGPTPLVPVTPGRLT